MFSDVFTLFPLRDSNSWTASWQVRLKLPLCCRCYSVNPYAGLHECENGARTTSYENNLFICLILLSFIYAIYELFAALKQFQQLISLTENKTSRTIFVLYYQPL